ncbi:hypothetical protein [Paractinoplanes durhamensis]|uniref:hypothetical protein n=1 Tax=Paractinoplanes durhamensis TaxID=113563 RepID=UPI00362AC44D
MQVSDAGRLRSFEVHSADGHFLGHVGTVYRAEDSVQPLLVSFPAERDTPFVAPLFGAELTAHTLVLAYPAAQVTDGPTVDTDVVLSAGEVGAVLGYYGRRVRFSRPLTERRKAPATSPPRSARCRSSHRYQASATRTCRRSS